MQWLPASTSIPTSYPQSTEAQFIPAAASCGVFLCHLDKGRSSFFIKRGPLGDAPISIHPNAPIQGPTPPCTCPCQPQKSTGQTSEDRLHETCRIGFILHSRLGARLMRNMSDAIQRKKRPVATS